MYSESGLLKKCARKKAQAPRSEDHGATHCIVAKLFS